MAARPELGGCRTTKGLRLLVISVKKGHPKACMVGGSGSRKGLQSVCGLDALEWSKQDWVLVGQVDLRHLIAARNHASTGIPIFISTSTSF